MVNPNPGPKTAPKKLGIVSPFKNGTLRDGPGWRTPRLEQRDDNVNDSGGNAAVAVAAADSAATAATANGPPTRRSSPARQPGGRSEPSLARQPEG